MSTVVVNPPGRLKRAFTEFDDKKMRKLMAIIFVLMLLLFLYLYLNRIDIQRRAGQALPFAGKPEFMFTIYGTEKDPLLKPMAVLELNHNIYVSDTDNHRIQVFDYDGNPLQIVGQRGKGKGEFEYPYGLAKDSQQQLYVADISNGNITVMSAGGQFIKYFGSKDDIKRPAGLFFSNNQLYVSDIALNKILVFDIDGKKVKEIGEAGTEPGKLRSPNALCVYKGKIYVADTGNDRVQIFSQAGQFLGILDGAVKPGGQSNLLAPRGVFVDNRGTAFVVNNLLHSINGYNQANNKLWTFGSMGNEDTQFYLPNGLWVDGQGRIYITDTVNQRVDVYQN